ncbi:Exocyst subunit Exo70 family protein [Heracleum sosnowskyi]|uniref:Exocyst subunit Exo70 family protein n=1 Tax=Heracleum sosnowskyi TaxID=360622 RepID=A0AAD8M2J8_9APIA|nr:Exocyst subunit Exo70 family protein [Heracleum sosnowskyi]
MRNCFTTPKSPSQPTRATFCSSIIDENMELAALIITKWNTDSLSQVKASPLFNDDRSESKAFLKSVDDLQFAMECFISENHSSNKLIHAQNLMQIAMKRLEKEFYVILSAHRDFLHSATSSLENDVSESDNQFDAAMVDLKTISDCMISHGYGKECAKIYKVVRKSVVDETLYYLGVESLSFSQIQKFNSQLIKLKINQWLKAIKVATEILFHGERSLCDHIFATSDTIRESCFAEISTSGGLMLLSFPENVAKCKKSPEKIFGLLDLYDAVSNHMEDIESIFSFNSTSAVLSQAASSLSILRDAIRVTLSEFESAIQKHTTQKTLRGGGVHPLTRYVMNYFVFLADYSNILPEMIVEEDLPTEFSMPESYFSANENSSAISLRFAWIILVLLCKLDSMSQLYKDVSLSYLFLANNLNYVVSKVKNSNMKALFGDEWLAKHQSKVQQYASNFERMSWIKLIKMLPENPAADISPDVAKKCFDLFNSGFEELYRKQCKWMVTDSKLRDEIKTSVSNRIIRLYKEFYEKNRQFFGREVGIVSIVRYAPEDLEKHLSDLFSGTASEQTTSSNTSLAASPAREVRRR